MINKFLKALIILSKFKLFKIFINLIENVACRFILLNKKKLYSNFLSIFNFLVQVKFIQILEKKIFYLS